MNPIAKAFNSAPRRSLLFGAHECLDRDGKGWTNCVLEGTPGGFRMLAAVLNHMADQVENDAKIVNGWGVSISPEDFKAVCGYNVRSLSLTCQKEDKFKVPSPDVQQ